MSHSSKTTSVTPFYPRPFPPKRVNQRKYASLLKQANLALKAYKTILENTSCPETLFAHFATLEAIDSLESQESSIALAEFLLTPKKHDSVVQIHNYLDALKTASRATSLSPFSRKEICSLHKIVKRSTAQKADAGHYRNRQNWIGPANCTIEEAYFYPPAAKDVEPMMEQLFNYSKQGPAKPLLQLALIFAQLLIIHPFMDGNGRMARLLVPLFLRQKQVLPLPFFFMSSYFNQHRLKYFQTLFKTTSENDWEKWITFFLKGIISQSRRYSRAMLQILKIHDKLQKKFPQLNQKGHAFLLQHPVFTGASYRATGNPADLLQELENAGWVSRSEEDTFHVVPLLKILQSLQKQKAPGKNSPGA